MTCFVTPHRLLPRDHHCVRGGQTGVVWSGPRSVVGWVQETVCSRKRSVPQVSVLKEPRYVESSVNTLATLPSYSARPRPATLSTARRSVLSAKARARNGRVTPRVTARALRRMVATSGAAMRLPVNMAAVAPRGATPPFPPARGGSACASCRGRLAWRGSSASVLVPSHHAAAPRVRHQVIRCVRGPFQIPPSEICHGAAVGVPAPLACNVKHGRGRSTCRSRGTERWCCLQAGANRGPSSTIGWVARRERG